MQKIFKQNNLGYFDALILLVCSTICVWAILVKVNLIKVDVISQVSSIEKVAQIVQVENDVRVRKTDVFYWKETQLQEPLGNGESIFVGNNSVGGVEFINGDRLIIQENSIVNIKYNKETGTHEVQLSQGNINLESKAETKLVVNGTQVQTSKNSMISINSSKSKLQFISKKGISNIGGVTLEEGTISDGTKVTRAFDLRIVGGTNITTSSDSSIVQLEFLGMEEEVDEYRMHLVNRSVDSKETLLFKQNQVQFKAALGRQSVYAEAYFKGEFIGQSPLVHFEVQRINNMAFVTPAPNENTLYVAKGGPVRISWNKSCDCNYKVVIKEQIKDGKVVLDKAVEERFVEFVPKFIKYSIQVKALVGEQVAGSISQQVEIKSNEQFNPNKLFSTLVDRIIFVGRPVAVNLQEISDSKLESIKLQISPRLDFSNPVEVNYQKGGFNFKQEGSYYVKAIWKMNGEEQEKISPDLVEVVDLVKLLSPPKAAPEVERAPQSESPAQPATGRWPQSVMVEDEVATIQSVGRAPAQVEIEATQTLRWAQADSMYQTFYRIEVADNPKFTNSKIIETDVNTAQIQLKAHKQYWRIKKIVRINNVLYEGDYSQPFEIKAYQPAEGLESKQKAQQKAQQKVEKLPVAAKVPKAPKEPKAPVQKPELNVAVKESAKEAQQSEAMPAASKAEENKIEEDVATIAVPEPEELDIPAAPVEKVKPRTTVAQETPTPKNIRPSAMQNSNQENIKKSSGITSTPNIKVINKKEEALSAVPVPSIPKVVVAPVAPVVPGGGADDPVITQKQKVKALETPQESVAIPGAVKENEVPPKIVFAPKKSINLNNNKVQLDVDNFDAQKIKYANLQYQNVSRTVPMKSSRLTLQADKMPAKSRITLLDVNKKPVSTLNLNLEPFYKNGCERPKYKVVEVDQINAVGAVKFDVPKGKVLFINFRPKTRKSGILKIKLGEQYNASLCNSETVELFKSKDLARIMIPIKRFKVTGHFASSSLVLSQDSFEAKGKASEFILGLQYQLSDYQLLYSGRFSLLSGDVEGASFSGNLLENALLYNLNTSSLRVQLGAAVTSMDIPKAEGDDVSNQMVHFIGGQILGYYPLNQQLIAMAGATFGVSVKSSTYLGLKLGMEYALSEEFSAEAFYQLNNFQLTDSELAEASFGLSRIALGLGYRF